MGLDIVCFSHIRWDAGMQRPQQLLRRFARQARVFYIENPVVQPEPARLLIAQVEDLSLWKVTPQFPENLSHEQQQNIHRQFVEQLIDLYSIHDYMLWYYNPAAMEYTDRLSPRLVIYDYVAGAGGSNILEWEKKLIHQAELSFSDGQRTCQKQHLYRGSQFLFPGCIDIDHFLEARGTEVRLAGQASIPHPRLGFHGVINELFDWQLVQAIAEQRPDWHFILVGPMTVDPEGMLNRPNVHYLSTRDYRELPAYLSGWDVAILPIAGQLGKTKLAALQIPQYLAGGCPVVATSVPEVVHSYESRSLAWIADTPSHFIKAVESALEVQKDEARWLEHVDCCLPDAVWDQVWGWFTQSVELAMKRQTVWLHGETVVNQNSV